MKPTEEIKAKIAARLAIRDANQSIKSNRHIMGGGPKKEPLLSDEDRAVLRANGGQASALLQHRGKKLAPGIVARIERGEDVQMTNPYTAAAVASLLASNAVQAAATITARQAGLLITQADFNEMQASDQAEFTALGGTVEGDAPAPDVATAAPDVATAAPATMAPSAKIDTATAAAKTMEEFRTLSPYARMSFIKGGGKLID